MLDIALALFLAGSQERYKAMTDRNECSLTVNSGDHEPKEHLPKGAYGYFIMFPLERKDYRSPYVFGVYDFDNKRWHELKASPKDKKFDNMQKYADECLEKALKAGPIAKKTDK